MNAKETLTQWLTDGDLERTLRGLLLIQRLWKVKRMGNHGFDTAFYLSRFNTVKTAHSKGTVSQTDYSIELARIRETTLEIVHWLFDDLWLEDLATIPASIEAVTRSHRLNTPVWWKRWELLLGILAALATITGLTLKDFFQKSEKDQPASVEQRAPDSTRLVPSAPIPQNSAPMEQEPKVKIEVKDKAKVGNIITGDSNKIDIKQDF